MHSLTQNNLAAVSVMFFMLLLNFFVWRYVWQQARIFHYHVTRRRNNLRRYAMLKPEPAQGRRRHGK